MTTTCPNCTYQFRNWLLRETCPKCNSFLKKQTFLHTEEQYDAQKRGEDEFDSAGFMLGLATGVPLSPTHGFSTGSMLGAVLHPNGPVHTANSVTLDTTSVANAHVEYNSPYPADEVRPTVSNAVPLEAAPVPVESVPETAPYSPPEPSYTPPTPSYDAPSYSAPPSYDPPSTDYSGSSSSDYSGGGSSSSDFGGGSSGGDGS